MARPAAQTTLRAIVAANVKRGRRALGLSQEAFADECGLHRTYIGSIERGERNVSLDNIERIASALGIAGYELLKEDDRPTIDRPRGAS